MSTAEKETFVRSEEHGWHGSTAIAMAVDAIWKAGAGSFCVAVGDFPAHGDTMRFRTGAELTPRGWMYLSFEDNGACGISTGVKDQGSAAQVATEMAMDTFRMTILSGDVWLQWLLVKGQIWVPASSKKVLAVEKTFTSWDDLNTFKV